MPEAPYPGPGWPYSGAALAALPGTGLAVAGLWRAVSRTGQAAVAGVSLGSAVSRAGLTSVSIARGGLISGQVRLGMLRGLAGLAIIAACATRRGTRFLRHLALAAALIVLHLHHLRPGASVLAGRT